MGVCFIFSTLLETAVNEENVIALFSEWNDALATGDPDVVTQMYADNAITFSSFTAVSKRVEKIKHTPISLRA